MNLKNIRIWRSAAEKRSERQKTYLLGLALFLIGFVLKFTDSKFPKDSEFKKMARVHQDRMEKVESGIKTIKL